MVSDLQKEMPGIILGIFIGGIAFGLIYFFGGAYSFLGSGGALAFLFMYSVFAFGYSTVNRRRRLDHVTGFALLGGFIGLVVNYFVYYGNILVNLGTSSDPVAFLIVIFVAIVILAYLIAGYAYAKATDLR